MRKFYEKYIKPTAYVLLLAYGIAGIVIWNDVSPTHWWRIFLILPIVLWGNWTWNKLTKLRYADEPKFFNVYERSPEGVETTLSISGDFTPETAAEIYSQAIKAIKRGATDV